MDGRPTPQEQVSPAVPEQAGRLARLLHENIDAPLSASIGAQGIEALSKNPQLVQQVHIALSGMSPNNSIRYSHAAKGYTRFWRNAVHGGTPYPQEIEIHPSAYCPLDCWYCCSPNNYAREKISPLSRNSRLLAYAQELSGVLETVQISGGREPLEDATLPDLLAGLRTQRVAVRLNTSGFSSKSGRLNGIIPDVDYTAVSIDGHTSQLYNQIKRLSGVGALEKVVENVRLATANPLRKGRMEMVVLVLPENQDFLDEPASFAEELGFDSVRFRRLKHHVVESSVVESAPTPIVYDDKMLRRIQDITLSRSSFVINVNSEDFLVGYDDYVRNNRSPCYSANRKIVIDALGYVYPCALHSYPGVDGHGISPGEAINIRDFSAFADLWRVHAPVISHYHAKPCANCYIADRYINNFVSRLAEDDRSGNLALAVSLFSGELGAPGAGG